MSKRHSLLGFGQTLLNVAHFDVGNPKLKVPVARGAPPERGGGLVLDRLSSCHWMGRREGCRERGRQDMAALDDRF